MFVVCFWNLRDWIVLSLLSLGNQKWSFFQSDSLLGGKLFVGSLVYRVLINLIFWMYTSWSSCFCVAKTCIFSTDELRMAVKEVICNDPKEREKYKEALVAITVDESLKRWVIRIHSLFPTFQLIGCVSPNHIVTFRQLLPADWKTRFLGRRVRATSEFPAF